MKFSVSEQVRTLCPGAALGVLSYRAVVCPSTPELLTRFEAEVAAQQKAYTLEGIAQNGHIHATRLAYKALGKSPHEYRNAAEAMLRRVVKGSGLYHINNIVEVNNLISIASGYSIGSYDEAGLTGDVELRRAPDGTHYDGIGKSSVNIGFLPVLYDDLGPFGNPSSDSRRAMIEPGERCVHSVLYAFDGPEGLQPWMQAFADALRQFCGVSEVAMQIAR